MLGIKIIIKTENLKKNVIKNVYVRVPLKVPWHESFYWNLLYFQKVFEKKNIIEQNLEF